MWRFLTAGVVVTAFVFGVFGVGNAHPQEGGSRLPVPVGKEFDEALELVQDVYRDEYEAARTSEQKRALAAKLLKDARDCESEANRFVMLRVARNIAAQTNDAELAMRAANQIASRFQLGLGTEAHEAAALEMKLAALTRAARGAATEEQLRGVVKHAQLVQDQAIRNDQFTRAAKLGECALAAARRVRDTNLIREVSTRNKLVGEFAQDFSEVQRALVTLEETPTDPDANLLAGRYYGFIKGDWKRALPMLALGADDELQALAQKELAGIHDPKELAEVGNGWWDLAQATKGPGRNNLMRKAYELYWEALPKLTGLSKRRITKRLQDLEAAIPGVAGGPGGAVPPPPAPATELAKKVKDPVEAGLEWLVANQSTNGSWSFTIAPNPGSLRESPATATSMALIPLLRSGSTHETGEYKDAVSDGLKFLATQVKMSPAGGMFIEPDAKFYGHGITTIALCEAYARSRDKRLAKAAQLAINYIVYAQDPMGGGWRYAPRQPGDTSVTGWQVAALLIGGDAGLKVPPQTLMGVTKFLDSVQANNGAYYGYTGPSVGRETTTSIGLLLRMRLGWKNDNPALQEGIRHLAREGPSKSNYYYNYYGSALMARYGGETGKKWCATATDYVIDAQQGKGTPMAGSWYTGLGDHGTSRGGRLYCTAMALMTLQNCSKCPD
jgi:hypothetical protein